MMLGLVNLGLRRCSSSSNMAGGIIMKWWNAGGYSFLSSTINWSYNSNSILREIHSRTYTVLGRLILLCLSFCLKLVAVGTGCGSAVELVQLSYGLFDHPWWCWRQRPREMRHVHDVRSTHIEIQLIFSPFLYKILVLIYEIHPRYKRFVCFEYFIYEMHTRTSFLFPCY